MLFLGRIYIARGSWHLRNFRNIFLPNVNEDQKKFYYLSAGLWHCPMWQIQRWLLHYVHKKFRWGPEVATLRTKTVDFTLVTRLNWFEKIELRGCAGPPGCQYYLLLITVVRVYCCTRVLLYPKMLKETENEETSFFGKFLSLMAFQLRGPEHSGPPPGFAYDFKIRSCP